LNHDVNNSPHKTKILLVKQDFEKYFMQLTKTVQFRHPSDFRYMLK